MNRSIHVLCVDLRNSSAAPIMGLPIVGVSNQTAVLNYSGPVSTAVKGSEYNCTLVLIATSVKSIGRVNWWKAAAPQHPNRSTPAVLSSPRCFGARLKTSRGDRARLRSQIADCCIVALQF